ncbi:VCBS repeat-containing protein [Flaviramulus sp. BrNp1-15]|uniref:VCBS repeat-containing protein n=1 Tax=Flaviramulus sp. BrNp1-15 TaxID=2916754 RepID=UPI001EE78AC9|nr:VCBS repeat-containing protein [Flaviramulus sp. BrNp1-15]ULC58019.1 VCBS repeat-containing protein [Flaviramulus sp. BrNp1-15]
MKVIGNIVVLFIVCLTVGCNKSGENSTLFQRVSANYSGINFKNEISTNDSINILNYEYLYNGGGVGIGYFNNDNLPDVFFTGNISKSRIYINKGELKFEDITETSKINTKGKWCTGISVIDINQDGLDDLYISVGGMGNKNKFPNLLYINNGDLTFTESAAQYGLADKGESIQSIFFDYDLDGDLDMYLLTGGGFENSAINVRPMLKNGSSRNTDRLYRNDFNKSLGHPVFTDVSNEAGINIEGFGLGVSVFDVNNDGWPDLYISNDYLSKDLLYVNQQNGSFKELGHDYFGHSSHFSMGNDIADINNDGFLDIVTMDMLPENVKRRKLMSGANSYDIFQIALRFGYGHQHMRNMLQLNNGNKTFSEIGQLAGIDKTDWSWAPLLADFDNDGYNDLYITNGFGKDITDMDFVKFRQSKASSFKNIENIKKSVIDCLYYRPAIKVANYAYKNNGNLTFNKVTENWGFNEESISNGAAYADLDLDGDLDLLVNNINQIAFVYKNTINDKKIKSSNYLQVILEGNPKNQKGIGAEVTLYANDIKQTKYNQPVKGFQSTIDSKLHFGLNNNNRIDSLIVKWPDGKVSIKENVDINTLIKVKYTNTLPEVTTTRTSKGKTFFYKDSIIQHIHKERYYNDYATQLLLMQGYSNQGPGLAVGDLNNDGLEDIFVAGAYGSNSTILYQNKKGNFETTEILNTQIYEDEGALIFDANNDGLQDLYVVSGGSERYDGHKSYQDRIYYNDGNKLIEGTLPTMLTSTSTITGGDYDNDGDIDLFIGGRITPGKFPKAPKSYILENNSGSFTDVTNIVCPFLNDAGMITSAVWTDFNNDTNLDLVIVGEFMPITFLQGTGKQLKNISENTTLSQTTGLWNSIQSGDFDNDGDIDFVAGNLGLNSIIKSTKNHPFKLDYADFDNNGFIDPIYSKYEDGNYYPVASLDNLTQQLPQLKKKFLYYNTFATSTTDDIISLFNTPYKTLEVQELKSSYIENLGNNNFSISELPLEVQISPVNGILSEDINNDGLLDIILVGNNYNTEVNGGRYDASIGNVLLNNGKGEFNIINNKKSGLSIIGDSKSIVKVNVKNKSLVVVGINNSVINSFVLEKEKNGHLEPKNNEVYALITFIDGGTRKIEFTLGGGYLSQSSKAIDISSKMEKITFYNKSGDITRSLDLTTK